MSWKSLLPLVCASSVLTFVASSPAQDYFGRISAPDATPTGGGLVDLRINACGSLSAVVQWDGRTGRVKGAVDASGRFSATLPDGTLVKLERNSGGTAVEGSVVRAGTAYPFSLANSEVRGEDEIVPRKGAFTSFIEAPPPAEETAVFEGDGAVAIKVAKPAKVQRGRFAGNMPDGEPFTAGSKYGGGKFPIFSNMYKRGKNFLGSVASDYEFQIVPDPDFSDRFFSDVKWKKEDEGSRLYYPDAIDKSLITEAFRFFPDPKTRLPFFDPPAPPPGEGAPLQVTISGGDLPAPMTKNVFYLPGRPIKVNDGTLRMHMNLNVLTGTMKGWFDYPEISSPVIRKETRTRFRGVVQIFANQGRAVFKGPTRSGRVVLRIAPR